ncbi:MAG TPA: endonuclease/exonuclease/phosphatase family protein [Stenomitos sp.]
MSDRVTIAPVGPNPYSYPSPAMAYGPMPTSPAQPATSYQGSPDQLYLSAYPPLASGVSPTVAPAAAPSIPLLPVLSGLLQQLQALVNRWLSAPGTPPAPGDQPPSRPATNFVISSFNVLGNSHTAPGGNKPGWDPGTVRIRSAAKLLEQHDVDVVGFQEMQRPQLKAFLEVAEDRYAVYPNLSKGTKDTDNAIAWRKDKWELVKPGSLEIPYFDGHKRKMPLLLLRNRQTGQEAYFLNVHNPADTRDHLNQERWRDQATGLEVELVNRLRRETGLPVFVTGDMNEQAEAFQHFTQGTDLAAANEGPGGKLPKQVGIDWIFGSPDVTFRGYTRDRSTIEHKTSDHPMVVSRARIDGASS